MPCYHPLKGWPIGTTAKGKTKYKITPYAVNHVERTTSGSYESVDVDFLTSRGVSAIRDYVEIPCGQCIGCRLDRSRAWADRCLLEASQYPHNCFLTLTYDDEHLPTREYDHSNEGADADTLGAGLANVRIIIDRQIHKDYLQTRYIINTL